LLETNPMFTRGRLFIDIWNGATFSLTRRRIKFTNTLTQQIVALKYISPEMYLKWGRMISKLTFCPLGW
jgi:hypothetical protein